MYSESISEFYVDREVAYLRFQFFQCPIHLPLSFAEAAQMVIQADVCLASTAHDCFAVTNLTEKRARPEIAARAVNVNPFTVEIYCHGLHRLIHAAYNSDCSWLTALRSWSEPRRRVDS